MSVKKMAVSAVLPFLVLASGRAVSQIPPPPRAVTPATGGTLTYAVATEPTALVSFLDTKTEDRNISAKITEGLLRYDAAFHPQPLLATEWKVSADGLRYTFKLRAGVKWSDGEPLTSADVRFSVMTQKALGPRGRITLASVDHVDTPDPLTAIIVLAKPAPFLLGSLSSAELPIVPLHRYPNEKDPLSSPNTNAPVGTGPFVFVKWVRGNYVELRRNPHYWRAGAPRLDRVIYRFIPDPGAIAAAIESGSVDAALNVAFVDLERLGRNASLRIDDSQDGYLNNASFLEFNLDNPILAKAEVRHAIAQTIDRDFITRSIHYKRSQVVNSPVPPALKNYYDDSAFHYPYDLQAANRLLDQAGYPRQADGQRFTLKLNSIPGPYFKPVTDYLRATLSRVGIRVEILNGDTPTFLRRAYTARDFDLNLNGLGRLYDPSVGVQRIYWSDGIRHPLIWVNASHYDNPRVDALFSQAAVETNDATRAEEFKSIQRIVGQDLPVYPIATVPSTQVYSNRVHALINSIDVLSGDFSDAWIEPVR